jgi:PPOX class probable FMN-dependent enzyme
MNPLFNVTSLAELEAIYDAPISDASLVKEVSVITDDYRRLIEASPFAILATCGPEGLDCSPRGDRPGFVRVHDERTLILPDRRGNNRIDSLRNAVRDPRIAMLFLIPGSGTTLRVNGRATISADPAALASLAVDGRSPRTILAVHVEAVYFQCARAIVRSELWNVERHVEPASLPAPGEILARLTEGRVGGRSYDEAWPERAAQTLW